MSECANLTGATQIIDPPEGSIPLTRRADAPVAARRCPATPGSTTVGTSAAAGDSPRAPAPVADADLLRAHLEGDPQSFNELIRRHRTLLRIVALRVLENHHDADDAVQDGLLRAFRGAHTYAGRSSVGAWLRTIIENTARTAVRNRQRAQLRVTDIDATRLADTEQAGADPAEIAADRDLIAGALAQIPDPWRHTFQLVKINGLTYAEAAEVLGVPIGTVRSRINRANAARARHRARENAESPGTS
ncbi:RNA polymerase sigma factor [Pseudonocardia sp. EC080625-04]|uniref:RNA polymerase sigma factor n=1 Tax=Pseudonocardia sp. EC080625-04 TaxID=1096868 RepID=UPI0007616EC9|nr:RNA polymerase sigma factor [Pseudonocardia sp. EC080625-04]